MSSLPGGAIANAETAREMMLGDAVSFGRESFEDVSV